MVKQHHQLNGHEFELIPGDSKGQRSLVCCSPWDRRVGPAEGLTLSLLLFTLNLENGKSVDTVGISNTQSFTLSPAWPRDNPFEGEFGSAEWMCLPRIPPLHSLETERKSIRPSDLILRVWPGLGAPGCDPGGLPQRGYQGRCCERFSAWPISCPILSGLGLSLSRGVSTRQAEKVPCRFFSDVFLRGEKRKLHELKTIVGT